MSRSAPMQIFIAMALIALGCGAIAFCYFDRDGHPSLRLLAMASALPLIVAGLFVAIGRPRLGTYTGVALFAAITIYMLARASGNIETVTRFALIALVSGICVYFVTPRYRKVN